MPPIIPSWHALQHTCINSISHRKSCDFMHKHSFIDQHSPCHQHHRLQLLVQEDPPVVLFSNGSHLERCLHLRNSPASCLFIPNLQLRHKLLAGAALLDCDCDGNGTSSVAAIAISAQSAIRGRLLTFEVTESIFDYGRLKFICARSS